MGTAAHFFLICGGFIHHNQIRSERFVAEHHCYKFSWKIL